MADLVIVLTLSSMCSKNCQQFHNLVTIARNHKYYHIKLLHNYCIHCIIELNDPHYFPLNNLILTKGHSIIIIIVRNK